MQKTVMAAVLVSGFGLVACGPASSVVEVCPSTITISGFSYAPKTCKIKLGASVTISAFAAHPLSGSGAGLNVVAVTGNQTITPTSTGRFDYRCDFHGSGGMTGSIVVEQ